METLLDRFRTSFISRTLVLSLTGFLAGVFPSISFANPSGATVSFGDVSFQGMGTSNLTINQGSNLAVINWQEFSIQSGEITTFSQSQGAGAIALNRVTSGNPTEIFGTLNANGGVLVINPNGILVGSSGVIDVGGLMTLSTLDVDDQDFLNGGANRFLGSSSAGVQNYGSITSRGGDVVVLGNFLKNAGNVSAPGGTVAFGAGGDILVEQSADGASISIAAAGAGADVGIENSGSVSGAAAQFASHGNAYALAIKNEGLVRAEGYQFSGGKLKLNAGSGGRFVNTGNLAARTAAGNGGSVEISAAQFEAAAGTIDASGGSLNTGGSVDIRADEITVGSDAFVKANGSSGGNISLAATTEAQIDGSLQSIGHTADGGAIDVTARRVVIQDDANLSAAGMAGGSIRVGGGFQGNDLDIANAQDVVVEGGSSIDVSGSLGDAGQAVIWADGSTDFSGKILAEASGNVGNGGFVEVSGKQTLRYDGFVSTSAENGQTGQLLLDPTDIVIAVAGDPAGTISDTALLAAINSNNVILHTNSPNAALGTITVKDGATLEYNSPNSLAFFANDDILINDRIQNEGTGGITLFAGWDGTGAGAFTFNPATPGTLPADPAPVDIATIKAGVYGDWGQNGGDIIINASSTDQSSVGSAHGQTNLVGNRIVVQTGSGADAWGQVGFTNATLNPTGDIEVLAKGDIIVASNNSGNGGGGQNDTHAMIGHGGSDRGPFTNGSVAQNLRSGDGDLSGDIRVISEGGELVIQGSNDRSFAQIGHGGNSLIGDKDGSIIVEAKGLKMLGGFLSNGGFDPTFHAHAAIGHGGAESSHGNGNGYSGDIVVVIDGDFTGSTGVRGAVDAAVNDIRIGHGGRVSGVNAGGAGPDRDTTGSQNGNAVSSTYAGHEGAVHVQVSGDTLIDLVGRDAEFRIGHGGRQSHGNHQVELLDNALETTATVDSGIDFRTGGDFIVTRGETQQNGGINSRRFTPIHIGLGGIQAGGRFSGDINVDVGGRMELSAGEDRAYAQIGHGGFADTRNTTDLDLLLPTNGYATLSGDITVRTGGDLAMYSGAWGFGAYSMIGHGGRGRIADGLLDGVLVPLSERGHHGDILVESGGDVIMSAVPKNFDEFERVTADSSHSQIGHGGAESSGDHYGLIQVNAAGDVTIAGGAQGFEYDANADNVLTSGQTGAANYAMVGHGGWFSTLSRLQDNGGAAFRFNGNDQGVGIGVIGLSDITVNSGGNVKLEGMSEIGVGRDILLSQNLNPAEANARGLGNFAMIGHGGQSSGDFEQELTPNSVINGNINVTADGRIDIIGSQLGPDNTVGFGSNDLNLRGFAMIGNGGIDFQSSFAGDILVDAGAGVLVKAGNNNESHALIGHGGRRAGVNNTNSADTSFTGSVRVFSGADIVVEGGDGQSDINRASFSYAQIGHNPQERASTIDDQLIVVTAFNDIVVQGGTATRDAYARIGHGGINNTDGEFSGLIDVTAGNDIRLISPDLQDVVRNGAKIGHGDVESTGLGRSSGTWNGDIEVKAGRNIEMFDAVIGHLDQVSDNTSADSLSGSTFIAVGRSDAQVGSGDLITNAGSRINSAVFGSGAGNELRIYLPGIGDVDNFIAEGTELNLQAYTRTPFPDGTRPDEIIAEEFSFTTDANGLPSGSFSPVGAYSPDPAFGRYNIYYTSTFVPQPPAPPTPPGPVIIPPAIPPAVGVGDSIVGGYDLFDLTRDELSDDSYWDAVMMRLSLTDTDAVDEELSVRSGSFFLEELLDAVFGSRSGATREDVALVYGEEDDEERLRRLRRSNRVVGNGSNVYYQPRFAPDGLYSSYEVFGNFGPRFR